MRTVKITMAIRQRMPRTVSNKIQGFRSKIKDNREYALGLLTVLPTLGVIIAAVIIPGGYALLASFHSIPAFDPDWTFVGLKNYIDVLGSAGFQNSLMIGVTYTVGSTVVQLLLGIAVALLVHTFRNKIVTAVTISLYIIPTAVVALIFDHMMTQRTGIIHTLLQSGGLIDSATSFWADSTLAMLSVILIGSYKFAMFVTIMVLARLQSIPSYYYEAATMSGATKLDKFIDITLPQLKGVIALVVLLRAIWMFNNFDVIWILTQGGPSGATETLPIYAFKTTFQNLQYGMGSAIAMLMFILLVIGGVAYLVIFNPEEDVEAGS